MTSSPTPSLPAALFPPDARIGIVLAVAAVAGTMMPSPAGASIGPLPQDSAEENEPAWNLQATGPQLGEQSAQGPTAWFEVSEQAIETDYLDALTLPRMEDPGPPWLVVELSNLMPSEWLGLHGQDVLEVGRDEVGVTLVVPNFRPGRTGEIENSTIRLNLRGEHFYSVADMADGVIDGVAAYGRLRTASVVIDYADESVVQGRFEGRVYPSREGPLSEPGRPSQQREANIWHRPDREVFVQGGFTACPAPTTEGRALAVVGAIFGGDPQDADGARCEVPFRVTEVSPPPLRENVNFESPGIYVEFSAPLDFEGIEEHFEVFTCRNDKAECDLKGKEQGRIPVEGEVARESDTRFSFRPAEPLDAGVIYEVQVIGGEDGVSARNGEKLPESEVWRFTTIVEPDEVTLHVYQTARDAPLVATKPTLTRIEVEWKRIPSIDEDWQAVSFPANVRVRGDGESLYEPDPYPVRIRRPDQYDAADRRHARETVNLFNWRPNRGDGAIALSAEVEAADPYPEPGTPVPEETCGPAVEPYRYCGEREADLWPHEPQQLTFDYYLLRLGDWRDDIPASDRRGAMSMTRTASEFTTQTFPVVSARGRYMGEHRPAGLYLSSPWISNQSKVQFAMESLHNHAGAGYGRDVTVALLPFGFLAKGLTHHGNQFDFRTVNVAWWGGTEETGYQGSEVTATLTHEFGHAYGLDDIESATIHGFRIAASGRYGWNKDSRYGNSQYQEGGEILPLMYPEDIVIDEGFIADAHYGQLLDVFPAGGRYGPERLGSVPGGWSDLLASAEPVIARTQSPRRGELMTWAAGFIHHRTGEAQLVTVRSGIERAPERPDGPYTAVLLDAGGRLLETTSFALAPAPDDAGGGSYFSVYLPEHPDATRLVIRDGERVLAERERAGVPPAVRLDVPVAGADLVGPTTVSWEGASDRTLGYSLLYSPTGTPPWQVLAADTEETSIEIDPSILEPGASPALRVVASDGFSEAHDDRAVTLRREPVPLLTLPSPDEPAARMLDVEAVFQTDIDAATLEERFVLTAGDGEDVDTHLLYDGHARVALLTPRAPLEADTHYTATLLAGVADVHGNRLEREHAWTFTTGSRDDTTAETRPPNLSASPGEERPEPERADASAAAGTGWVEVDGRRWEFTVAACRLGLQAGGGDELQGAGETDSGARLQVEVYREGDPYRMDIVRIGVQGEDLFVAQAQQVDGEWVDVQGRPAVPLVDAHGGTITARGEVFSSIRRDERSFSLRAVCR